MLKAPRGPYYTQDPEWFDARRDRILKARREGQTFGAIGKTWGITGERVRQIVVKEFKRRRNRADQRPDQGTTASPGVGAYTESEELEDAPCGAAGRPQRRVSGGRVR